MTPETRARLEEAATAVRERQEPQWRVLAYGVEGVAGLWLPCVCIEGCLSPDPKIRRMWHLNFPHYADCPGTGKVLNEFPGHSDGAILGHIEDLVDKAGGSLLNFRDHALFALGSFALAPQAKGHGPTRLSAALDAITAAARSTP